MTARTMSEGVRSGERNEMTATATVEEMAITIANGGKIRTVDETRTITMIAIAAETIGKIEPGRTTTTASVDAKNEENAVVAPMTEETNAVIDTAVEVGTRNERAIEKIVVGVVIPMIAGNGEGTRNTTMRTGTRRRGIGIINITSSSHRAQEQQ
jgi:hypothetical protein